MRKPFGTTADGKEAGLYILRNSREMKAAVSDYGATLVQLNIKDKKGVIRDMVLGYDDVAGYEKGQESFGGTVGRVANRIGQGRFTINGRNWQLSTNNGPNTLHGGRDFYVHRLWTLEAESDDSVTFGLESPDGDQGFPGNVHISVTYTVTEKNELRIDYKAKADADTPLNLTNHSYFNLGGHDSGCVLSQIVTIHADQITENDQNSLPTGAFLKVEGTPMDFCRPKELGQDIQEKYKALIFGNGYDHNYVINGTGYREAAVMYCKETGIKMTVSTDLPGVQVYTANYLDKEPGKGGAVYHARDAVCFESQFFPDAINKENFPGGALKAGEIFISTTAYGFSVKDQRR